MLDATNRSETVALPYFLRGAMGSHPFVKICGVTNPEDALAAIESGADGLGFNLFAGSKRFVRLDSARDWISELPPQIARVAVGVNPALAEVEDWLAGDLFHALQLHGQSWYPLATRLVATGKPLIAAIQVRADTRQPLDLEWFPGFAVMFDGYREGDFGGTGETYPIEIRQTADFGRRLTA